MGIYNSYQETNLRFSQLASLSMFEKKNTTNNLPVETSLFTTQGQEFKFAFVQKGGGSDNKTFLHQATPDTLNPKI